jgi:hypothetical protein
MQIPNGIQSPGPAEAGRPIGYWLKHLDRLIDDSFSRALAADELTRRHWQVLNTLARGPASPAELTQALEPFLRGPAPLAATTVDDLISPAGSAAINRTGGSRQRAADGRR